MTPAILGLAVPFGAVMLTLGMFAARAMIVANPEKVGLRPCNDQQQDDSVIRHILGRLETIRAEERRLGDQLFLATERVKEREAGRLGEAP
jgi:hypothetical protein